MSDVPMTDPAVVAHIAEILEAGGRVITRENVHVAGEEVNVSETYNDFTGGVSAVQFLNRVSGDGQQEPADDE